MNAQELMRAGQLNEAVESALAAVRQKPTDADTRYFLAETLCIAGDLLRADKQLDTISRQHPEYTVHVSLLRQLVRAETARREFYTQGRVPEVLFDVTPHVRNYLEASVARRDGDLVRVAELLAAAEEQRPTVSGKHGDTAFSDIRDQDDTTAGILELLTSTGKYYWVPLERLRRLEFRTPAHPTDILWRPAEVDVEGGPEGVVYIPAIYGYTSTDDEASLRMGRATQWHEEQGLAWGLGQRMYWVGDQEFPIMELSTLTFDKA